MIASPVSRMSVLIGLASILTGCDYYKQQRGYLVIRSEPFIHHYVGSPCGVAPPPIEVHPIEGTSQVECDVPEMRYTLIHKAVRITASCQSWDDQNKCRQLQVGETHQCDVHPASAFGSQLLSCGDHSSLEMGISEKK